MATGILGTLARLGVTVRVVNGSRVRLEPASRIPAELVPRIREAKTEILVALQALSPVAERIEAAAADPVRDAIEALLRPGEHIDEHGTIRRFQSG